MSEKMKEFYSLTIRQAIDLKHEVENNGAVVGETFNRETYRNNSLVEYKGCIYQIDSVLGIVDIKEGKA